MLFWNICLLRTSEKKYSFIDQLSQFCFDPKYLSDIGSPEYPSFKAIGIFSLLRLRLDRIVEH